MTSAGGISTDLDEASGTIDIGSDAAMRQIRAACELAVQWLNDSYARPTSRNSRALDIGLPPEYRLQVKGAPARPGPAVASGWIPWAFSQGIDPVAELDYSQAAAFAQHRSDLLESFNVRRRRFYALGAFHRYLRKRHLLHLIPTELLDRLDMQRLGLAADYATDTTPLTAMQVRALYVAAALDPTPHRTRNTALIAVLSATACRAAELVRLDLGDYKRTAPGGDALVRLHGKGGKTRWQKLPAADADLLAAYLAVRIAPPIAADVALPSQVSNRRTVEQPLFTTGQGQRLHPDVIRPLLRRIARIPTPDHPDPLVRGAELELRPIRDTLHPHQFRHGYAVDADRAGVRPTQVQADLGHATLRTTQTYLHTANVAANSAASTVSALYHAGDADLARLRRTVDTTGPPAPDDLTTSR